MKIGTNLFGPKFRLYDDFDGTLKLLKKGGIDSAELCVLYMPEKKEDDQTADTVINERQFSQEELLRMTGGIWPAQIARERLEKVRAAGMDVISVHVMALSDKPEDLSGTVPELIRFAKENDISYYVLSLMCDTEKMRDYIPVLRSASEELQKEGIIFCYHNHETECYEENGDTALDLVMRECPDLKLELDVGWAQFAGADPVSLMEKYKDRLALLHIKDITADACPEKRDDCFTAVGEGSIPLNEIIREAVQIGLSDNEIIIDQDDSKTDIIEDLKIGAENIKKAAEAVLA